MLRNRMRPTRRRLFAATIAALLLAPGAASAAWEWNFQQPATPVAQQIMDLHNLIFWICVVIFVGVFGVMFYSLIKHRKSVGHKAVQFHENTTVEIVWTVIPFLILLFMALKAGLIVAVFMHMAWERLALAYAILLPPVLVLVFVAIMVFESDYTHLLRVIFFAPTT